MKQKAKIHVATALIAATVITAQAQSGGAAYDREYGPQGFNAFHWVTRGWSWLTSNFTRGDFVQGVTQMNNNPAQAMANNSAYGCAQAAGAGGIKPNVKEK